MKDSRATPERLHYSVPACGAHNRPQHCREINQQPEAERHVAQLPQQPDPDRMELARKWLAVARGEAEPTSTGVSCSFSGDDFALESGSRS
jgi:hypothetical protein